MIGEEDEEKQKKREDKGSVIGSDGVDVSAAESRRRTFGLSPGFRFNRVEEGQFMLARERGGPADT